MSLFIKGATMPETCWECIDKHRLNHAANCTIHNNLYHRLMNINDPILRQRRAEDCPLVNVPASHGDLIDKNELMKSMRSYYPSIDHICRSEHVRTRSDIENAPIIIEAEGEV